MFQYFVGRLFGDLPANFNYLIGKKCEYKISIGYYELYEGTNKSSGEEVSIFLYEKKINENSLLKRYTCNNLNYSKKLIHPNILKVLYTYENDKRIYIVTEKCTPLFVENIVRDPIWGLYEIINAVNFINASNFIHCLICPFSIFVNSRGRWKLSVFDCIHDKYSDIENIESFIKGHIFYQYGYFRVFIPLDTHSTYIDAYGLALLMYWAYAKYTETANEFDNSFMNSCSTRNPDEEKKSTENINLVEKGKNQEHFFGLENEKENKRNDSSFSNRKEENQKEPKDFLYSLKNSVFKDTRDFVFADNKYEKNSSNAHFNFDLFHIQLEKGKHHIPHNLHIIYDMLNDYNRKEMDFKKILNSEHLKNNSIVKIMLFLSELHMKSKMEKTDFLEKLYADIKCLSTNLKFQMILPELIEHLEIYENICLCLKIILHICKDLSTDHFQKQVYPTFLKYFSLTDRPIRYAILENFNLIENHLSKDNINELYPHYVCGLTDRHASIKNESIKNFIYIFPRLKKSYASTSINTLLENLKDNDSCIKINTIICIAKIAKYIISDKQNILENVFHVGIHDLSPQTRIVTLQSIKATYEEFCHKRYVLNIIPIVVKGLVDENVQVRMYAFDTIEFSISLLKKELLKEELMKGDKKENIIDSIKSYYFIDKIKDIIKIKTGEEGDAIGDGEDGGIQIEKGDNIEAANYNEDINMSIGIEQWEVKEPMDVENLIDYGDITICNNNSRHRETVKEKESFERYTGRDKEKNKETEKRHEYSWKHDNKMHKTKSKEKNPYEEEETWKRGLKKNGEEEEKKEKEKEKEKEKDNFHTKGNNYRGTEQYHNFSNNIAGLNSNKSCYIYGNVDNNRKDHKHNYAFHSTSVNPNLDKKSTHMHEKDIHQVNNTGNVDLLNTSIIGHARKNTPLNDFNGHIENYRYSTHTKNKGKKQQHLHEKKNKKKMDIDIDEFFDEFNLKDENIKSKVKLSSLL